MHFLSNDLMGFLRIRVCFDLVGNEGKDPDVGTSPGGNPSPDRLDDAQGLAPAIAGGYTLAGIGSVGISGVSIAGSSRAGGNLTGSLNTAVTEQTTVNIGGLRGQDTNCINSSCSYAISAFRFGPRFCGVRIRSSIASFLAMNCASPIGRPLRLCCSNPSSATCSDSDNSSNPAKSDTGIGGGASATPRFKRRAGVSGCQAGLSRQLAPFACRSRSAN